jgi:hypothetical protein
VINSIACTITRPTGGIVEDITEEDEQRGYEDEPEARLWGYLARLVREADARVAAGRPRHTVGLSSGRLVVGADQRCVCRRPADQCRCKDPYPAGRKRVVEGPTACDWCGQRDHDPIKPQDGESVMTVKAVAR